jgi:uncharacterized protein (DUF1697 family)
MPKLFAFLRAINVGGHVVKMDQLRDFFIAVGFVNVETFIASGNVIFESRSKNPAALQRKIEDYLAKSVGYEVATFVRTFAELERINKYQPFSEAELNTQGNTLYVGFIADIPGKAAAQNVAALATDVDDLKINGREVYWLCRTSFSDTKISGSLLERTLGMKVTLRNINTVRRLVKKYS